MRLKSKTLLAALLLASTPVTLTSQDSDDDPRSDRALWRSIKRALQADNGEEYFETSFKGALVPGGTNGWDDFHGTVLSAEPRAKPSKLVVSIVDRKTPEITLRLGAALKKEVHSDSDVWFHGVAMEFSRDPFMVTFDVNIEDVKFERPQARGTKREIPLPKP